jgi:hypothetical protein
MRLVIAGAGGRMGRALIEMVLRSSDLQLAAAVEVRGSPLIGKDAGELVGIPCGVKIAEEFENGDYRSISRVPRGRSRISSSARAHALVIERPAHQPERAHR